MREGCDIAIASRFAGKNAVHGWNSVRAALSRLHMAGLPVLTGDSCAHGVPSMHGVLASEAAGDRDVAASRIASRRAGATQTDAEIRVDDSEESGV